MSIARFPLFFILSVFLSLVVAALWIRSYIITEWHCVAGLGCLGCSLTFHPIAGEVEIVVDCPPDPSRASSYSGCRVLPTMRRPDMRKRYHTAGFAIEPTRHFPPTPTKPERFSTDIVLPYYFVALLTGIPLVFFSIRELKFRRQAVALRRGLCANCGYDLRESPNRCPECGLQLRPHQRVGRARSVFPYQL